MTRKSSKGWWSIYGFIFLIALALIFLLFVCVFRKRISKWLEGKDDFSLPRFRRGALTLPKKGVILKKNEKRCREIFESIFGSPFPSVRPSFLKRKNGKALELDGYNHKLKLAFEYNGVQHYKFSPIFHASPNDFRDQEQRDRDKRRMCAAAGVTLIEIPYTVKYEDLETFIRRRLSELKILNQK
jgi:hypothetical protein